MKQLFLEDMKDMDNDAIIAHLAHEYAEDKYEEVAKLKTMEILIAYESVGSWGCDSSSFFLFREKKTQILYTVHGSHCSCYGFEGQLDFVETDLKTIKALAAKNNVFYTGGYDNDENGNKKAVNDFIISMR